MNKRGDVWVSAALYIAIGVVIISILLSAGLPVLNKWKDKNAIADTKDLMLDLDNTIRETFEGPGSQRRFDLEIRKGDFLIDFSGDTINWSLETSFKATEVGQAIPVGNLNLFTEEVGKNYLVGLSLGYNGTANLSSDKSKINIKGRNILLIKNEGDRNISISLG